MTTFEGLFWLGMKRHLPPLLEAPAGLSIGVGESGLYTNGDISFGSPSWKWPRDKLPCGDNTVALMHCYHFLEHLSGEDVISFLKESQRVLMVGGVLQFCVPYYSSEMAHHDFTHKTFWTESSFQNLMNNTYYDMDGAGFEWKLRVHYQVIAAIVERNLALLGQLERTA